MKRWCCWVLILLGVFPSAAAFAQEQGHGRPPLGHLAGKSEGAVLKIDPAMLPASEDNPWFAVKGPSIEAKGHRYYKAYVT